MDASVDLNLAPTLPLLRCNSSSRSASSSDVMEIEYLSRFNKLNPAKHETLTRELERKVPWQKQIIPEIATTILKCRSGTTKRRGSPQENDRNETWLVFQGIDRDGKEKIGRELARVVFGSYSSFASIKKTPYESDEPQRCHLFERFAEEVSVNPHRVFFIENAEEADRGSCLEFKKATESGKIKNPNFGEEVDLSDAIVIFSNESRKGSGFSFDLNVSIDEESKEFEEDNMGTMFGFVDGTCRFEEL